MAARAVLNNQSIDYIKNYKKAVHGHTEGEKGNNKKQ